MGINWKIVAGQIGQTMADRENEYRKFATDYFVKRYETQAEEKRQWEQTTREQKREIDKKVDALRAEGLTDTQIANGLNTYGENFFAVVADDLKRFKGSSNYTSLLQQDKTGAKYRDEYRKRFDTLLVTEQQRSLEIEPVVQGLLDKFPQSTETPDITQSIFGYDYTKGIRDDIKGLSKDTNVPDYDAPVGLVGVSDLMSSTIRDVPEQQTYTVNMLDKQIVLRLEARFGDLGIVQDGTRFETKAGMTAKEIEQVRKAKAAQLEVQRKFNQERKITPPGSMEGGMSDQELLDKIITDLGYGPASAGGKDPGGKDPGGKDPGGKGNQTVTLDTFSSNVTAYLQNNPGGNNKVSNLIGALQSVNGVNNTVLQKVLSAIASGKGFASSLKDEENKKITLNKDQKTAINKAISALDSEDKDILRELTGGSASPDPATQIKTADTFTAPVRPQDPEEAKIWDSLFKNYFAADGKVIASAIDEFTITERFVQNQIDKYNAAISLRKQKSQEESFGSGAA